MFFQNRWKQRIAAVTACGFLAACVTPAQQNSNVLPGKGKEGLPGVSLPIEADPFDVDPKPELEVGYRPALNTDEGGWWMKMDRFEENLKSHASLVRDPELNAYVSGIVCKLAGDYCGDIRVYIVRTSGFNASMSPNGVMQVHTGLLLRVENEAQLAAVLGHELAHYFKLHSIKNWRVRRNTADVLAFLTLGTAGIGGGLIGLGASVIALGGLSSYSQGNETEADIVGQVIMAEAGYDPTEAARLWERIKGEQDSSDDAGKRGSFLSTHPSPSQRKAKLDRQARWLVEKYQELDVGASAFTAAMQPHWRDYLQDEIAGGDFGSLEYLLQNLPEKAYAPVLVNYFKGELHRKRNGDGDVARALDHYRAALEETAEQGEGDVMLPPDIHRSIGLLHMKEKERMLAVESFRRYLALAPDSHDSGFIRQILEDL